MKMNDVLMLVVFMILCGLMIAEVSLDKVDHTALIKACAAAGGEIVTRDELCIKHNSIINLN